MINLKDFIHVENYNGNLVATATLENNTIIKNTYIGYTKSKVKSLMCDYIKKNHVIASNGYLNIIDIYHGIDDYILLDTKSNNYKKLYYDKNGDTYFKLNNIKYNLNEFFKTK